jgi:hypothetical protein
MYLLNRKLFQKKFDQKLLVTVWSIGATVMFYHKPFEKSLTTDLLRKCLIKNSATFGFKSLIPKTLSGVITTLFKKGLTANFFKKSLIKNGVTFGFECLIPKPYQA